MARFRAEIQGARGPASRLGHQIIRAFVNGWERGLVVAAHRLSDKHGDDEFVVQLTGGSSPTYYGRTLLIIKPNGRVDLFLRNEVRTFWIGKDIEDPREGR